MPSSQGRSCGWPSREIIPWVTREFTFEDENTLELHWFTKRSTRKPGKWEATTEEGDRYTITSRGLGKLVNLTFREGGTPVLSRASRIASTETFELAVVCASCHYFRLTNSRRLDARAAQRSDTGQTEEKDIDSQD